MKLPWARTLERSSDDPTSSIEELAIDDVDEIVGGVTWHVWLTDEPDTPPTRPGEDDQD